MQRCKIVVGFVCTLFGCGGDRSPDTAGTTGALAEDGQAACFEAMVRARECGDLYIPAWVDVRVRHDVPRGIASKDREMGRAALVAIAQREWAQDSQDGSLRSTCASMLENVPTEQLTDLSGATRACRAKVDCAEFVPCFVSLVEQTLQ
jgi:hypothetical protein